MTNTETLLSFYGDPANSGLVNDFVADAGGDPHEYGAEDPESLMAVFGQALGIFTRNSVELGFITDPAVAAAAAADDVDWDAVGEAAMRALGG